MMSTPLKNPGNSHPPLRNVTGVILAGGKSSRYGHNKALVEFEGMRLIDRTATIMRAIFDHVILVTNTPHEYAYLGLPMFRDLIPGLGPLGGVYTGLEMTTNETGFFVACDMPFLNPGLILHMVELRGSYDAVVPRIGRLLEPLHALYSRSCLPAIKDLIRCREYQIFLFYPRIRVRYLEKEGIQAFDPQLRVFFNINAP